MVCGLIVFVVWWAVCIGVFQVLGVGGIVGAGIFVVSGEAAYKYAGEHLYVSRMQLFDHMLKPFDLAILSIHITSHPSWMTICIFLLAI